MNVPPLQAISIGRTGMPESGLGEVSHEGPSFMKMVGSEVGQLNVSLNQADQAARELAAGDAVPVHDVMIAMEHARLKLQLAVEVRNRIVDAYQNLTNMQL